MHTGTLINRQIYAPKRRPRLVRSLELLAGSALVLHCALASGEGVSAPGPANASTDPVEEVVVAGHYEFLSADTSGATNLPLPIEKVPQSISLVSADFIKAADLKTLGEIAEYTPGALDVGNQEGFGTMIKLRGFAAAQSVDGINVGVLSGTSYEPDYAIIDRLEVVKGPSSVTYGVSSAGGLVNFVTKSATRDTPSYLSVEGGSWNTFRFEGQIAGALDAQERFRAIGVAVRDQGDSFMDEVNHSSTLFYGGINANLTDSVTGYLHGGYERHVRTGFDGIPTEADGSPAPVPRSFFIGSKNMELTSVVYHAEGNLTWHATDLLDLSLKGNYRRVATRGRAPYSFGLDTNGNIGLAVQDFQPYLADDYGVGVSGVYRLDRLGVADSFISLAALYQDDLSSAHQGQALFDGQPTGTANIFDGEASIARILDTSVPTGVTSISEEESKTLTISAQSVVQVVKHLSVLLGASYAKPKITNDTDGVHQDYTPAGQVSYRAGLTYEFLPGANAYVSFSQSFNPQTTIDINSNVLPPVKGEQYEGGVKYRSTNGRLLLTGAVFQITQKNQEQFDTQIDGLDRYRAVGEVKHKGFELEGVGRLTRQWQLNAGYAYLDPTVVKDSVAANVGQTELFLPKQTYSVFSTYSFDYGPLQGLSVGGGARYIGAVRTAFDGSTKDIAGYAVADLTLGYAVDKWSVQLNAHNIFNRRYFINNYYTLFYGNTPGAPTSVALSVRRNF